MRVIHNWCMDTQIVSKNQTQNVHGVLLGRRIKFLRGELSQHAFAEKIGVSRAALANYETGRTLPNESVIRSISETLDVGPEFLKSGFTQNTYGLLNLLGLGNDRSSVLTADEWAIIQGLRTCPPEQVRQAVSFIAQGYFDLRQSVVSSDPIGVAEDLLRLQMILDKDGQFAKGPARDNRTESLRALERRLSVLKSDGN